MNRRQAVSPIQPGLIVLHSNRMEMLRDSLIGWLTDHPLDPLETDILAVQSNGIAQWLRSTMARTDQHDGPGIAAALDTPMPARLLWSLYRRVLGQDAVPPASPLDEQPLTWRLMRLLGHLPENSYYQPLRQFLQNDPDLRKRYQLAQRLADLYDQYQVYRADWLADWAVGEDQLRGHRGNRPLDADQCWQAALWRDILADVGPEAASVGRAGVHERFVQTLRSWPAENGRPDLPRRIVVFGVSSLPRQSLEALIEAARWVQVFVCVHNPCEYHWSDIVEGRDLLRNAKRKTNVKPGMPSELDDDALHAHAHPLLASWGRQGRDYIALLEELEEESTANHAAAIEAAGPDGGTLPVELKPAPVFVPIENATMLGALQDDIRGLRSLPEVREEERVAATSDRSIQFHVAHSALREVEILHDQLLAAFEEDLTLQPDEVIVMVPDIEQYAPYIDAIFGLYGPEDKRRIPYFIVDRGAGRVNTVADAVQKLLALPTARMGASEVLDLLDIAAVRRRFALSDEDVSVLREWIQSANIRWGLDSEHRESLGLPIEASLADLHTWSFGLRRMLLGYAVGQADEWNGISPHEDVAGLDAALVGTLARILEAMLFHTRELQQPATPAQWAHRLTALLDDFLQAPDTTSAYTIEQLRQAVESWLKECEESGFDEPLTLQVVGERWLSCLQDAGMAQRFTSESVTFATLMPMRAIPFRLVCLLGMNDGDYPRPRTPAHFDLMEKDYRPGDRSRRDDDRYLFLEALLSARDRFYVSWVGRSVIDNAESPPSVLVGQLRDHLAAVWQADGDHPGVLEQITIEHPLQGFNSDYFRSDGTGSGLFTYSKEWRATDSAPATELPAATDKLTEMRWDESLAFSDLKRFLEQPVQAFFENRLQLRDIEVGVVNDIETFVGEPLGNWALNDALIKTARKYLDAGEDPLQACLEEVDRQRRSGRLAFGAAGDIQAEASLNSVSSTFERYSEYLTEWPMPAEESLELRHLCRGTPGVSGWIHGLRSRGDEDRLWLNIQATRLTEGKSKHWRDDKLLGHWVQHLAANSLGLPLTTVVISPGGDAEFHPIEAERAAAWLDVLLRAWTEGMRRPLPVKASFARPILSAIPSDFHAEDHPSPWMALLELEDVQAAVEAAYSATVFRGGWDVEGYEGRAYPDLETMLGEGELLRWVVTLYRPLFIALRSKEPA